MKFNITVRRFFEDLTYICESVMEKEGLAEFEEEQISQLFRTISETQEHLSEPLRVAVSGFMKAGKSTIMNALLREKVVCTGGLVTTYIVTWFRYGEEKELDVVFRDGTKERYPLDEIENWTVIDKVQINPRMRDVEYIIVYYPNELLKKIELIDTPGLFSPENEDTGDSQNTLDFLGLEAIEDANLINSNAASKADAIIYAFGRGFLENDYKIVRAFTTTSINAVGVFSKVDQSYWSCFEAEKKPTDVVEPVVNRLSGELKENLYRIIPVTALCVEGSLGLTDEHWETLQEIAALDHNTFVKIIADSENFMHRVYKNVAITPERRAPLLPLLGQYGIYLAVCGIREGLDRSQITEYLYEQSGLGDLYQLILRHFGNRSYLIKTDVALKRIEMSLEAMEYAGAVSSEIRDVCDLVHDKINALRRDNSFTELNCLRDYYAGKIKLPKRKSGTLTMDEQFLHIMGEYGRNCNARLGFSEPVAMEVLAKTALTWISDWSKLTGILYSKTINHTAKTVISRLQEMYMHLDALCDAIEN